MSIARINDALKETDLEWLATEGMPIDTLLANVVERLIAENKKLRAAVAEEREECAKIADGLAKDWAEKGGSEKSPGLQLSLLARVEACKTIAEYIRARSNPAV